MAKHIDEEATQYIDPKASKPKTQQPPAKVVVDTKVPETKVPGKPGKSTWKNKVAGAGSGLLIGGIAGVMMSAKAPDDVNAEDNQETSPNHSEALSNPDLVDDQVMVATGVNDDMSFGEAFAEARAEVGPGGIFEWHGHLYGTYTADEWNNMSPDEKADYNSHFAWNNIDTTESDVHNLVAEATTEPQPEIVEAVEGEAQPEVAVVEEVPQMEVTQPVEIEVIGVTQDADSGAILAGVLVDDQPAILVDVDQDNVFDALVADFDGNGEITADEIIDIHAQNLTVEDAIHSMGDDPHQMASYDDPMGADDYSGIDGGDDFAGGLTDDPMIFDA